jgi:hypothetical protein
MNRLLLGGTFISSISRGGLTVASKISCTPYWPVVSIRSRANAIPGKMFAKKINYHQSNSFQFILSFSLVRDDMERGTRTYPSRRNDSIIPSIRPITPIIR